MTDNHKADLDRVSHQNNFTDLARDAAEHPHGGGFLKELINGVIRAAAAPTPYSEAMVSRTEFEQRSLNEMLDLVEQTDPEDLESSGKALWDARDAIKAAAEELKGQFETVPWVGKSGDAFRTWGAGLVSSTYDLSTFAGGAGDQITAAAVGLASVRGAMPPRDPANLKRPSAYSSVEKAANKEEYADAVKVEKNRQEAINQMNRLASYYAVSREQLQVLHDDAPTFKDVPDVGVPKPKTAQRDVSGGTDSGTPQQTGAASVPAGHPSIAPTTRHVVAPTGHVPTPAQDLPTHTEVPDRPVGTNIDTVGTLPPTTTTPSTGHTPPVPGAPPASGGGQFPPYNGPLGTPVTGGPTGRGLSGAGGFRTPTSAQGGTRAPGAAGPGSGRSAGQGPMNQMGRATSTGQSAAGGTTSGAKPTSMGRAVTGGTPRPGGTAAPRTSSGPTTGAGRSNGVVGGRPSSTSGVSKGGSRIPRGTVVGSGEAVNARPAAGRIGQRGVVGATEPAARSGPAAAAGSRTGATASEGVTGRPAGRNSAAGAERNGMTRGGAGLARGARGKQKPADDEEAQRSTRPDYLVEDEETHLPDSPRRDVPPVIN
ncbi:hypothetical protein ACWDU8_22705 [Streptomyces sp. NPDC003388]